MELSSVPAVARPSFVHRHYLLLKAHYFLFFSAFGILYPIISITLRARGLSTTELSYINTIIPFLVFVTNPLVGFIADHSRRYLLTFNVVLGLATIIYTILFLLPQVKSHHIHAELSYDGQSGPVLEFCASQEVATACASRSACGCTYRANCTVQEASVFFEFSMSSQNTQKEMNDVYNPNQPNTCGIEYRVLVNQSIEAQNQKNSILRNSDLLTSDTTASSTFDCSITCSIEHYCHGARQKNQMRYIIFYALLFVAGNTFLSNTASLGASIGFASLHRPDIFGQQRVWGTIGFGILAFLASRAYEIFQTEYVYIIMFATATILCIIVTSFIAIQPRKQDLAVEDELVVKNEKKEKKKKAPFQASSLLALLKKVDVIIFLSLALLWGMSFSVLDPYLYLFIDEIEPCRARAIIGYMSIVSASAEVVALFFGGRLLKFFGPNLSSILILLAFAFRFTGYYLIPNPYYMIPMETMQFFNFGILFILVAQKADAIAPPGLSGTLQGVALGLSLGLGRGIGLLASSFIYTSLPQRQLFIIYAGFNIIVAIIYGIYFLIDRQRRSKTNENTTNITNTEKTVPIESDADLNEQPLLSPVGQTKFDREPVPQ